MKIQANEYRDSNFFFPSLDIQIPDKVQRIGVFGKNGSGKTTFFRILSNRYEVDNTIVRSAITLKSIEVLPQTFSVLNQFISTRQFIRDVFFMENIVGDWELDSEVASHLDKKLCKLSGGELKKLLLWMSFKKNKEVLLLDEVLTNLDPKSEQDVLRQIKKIGEKIDLVFLSSHSKEHLIAFSDWMIGFSDRRVMFSGDKDTFLSSDVFEKLHEI